MRVATAIAPQLRDQELGRALRKHPDSMTAYDLTLQALDVSYRMDRAAIEHARDLLERACALDPGYAPAFSQLASMHLWLFGQGWSDDERASMERTAVAARHAIERDRNDAVGLAIYGHTQSYLLKNYQAGHSYLERAIVAGPSCASAWAYSGLTCGYLGDTATAVARTEKAVRLSPVGPDAYWLEHFLSQSYYLAGRFEDAVSWARMSAAHVGSNVSNLRCLVASLVAAGRMEEARSAARQIVRLVPDFHLSQYLQRTPLTGDIRDLFVQRLGRAGLPD